MYLQAAIDTETIEDAEEAVARVSQVREISVIEIGTPLISHYGDLSVKHFSKYVGTNRLYADLKSIDFPLTEIRPFHKMGISRFSVMAFMNDEAFRELADFATTQALEIFVSTMGFPLSELAARAAQLLPYGFARFIAHGSGASEATAFFDMTRRAQILAQVPGATIIGAGGINVTNAHLLRGLGLSGLIIGRGLSNQPDPGAAANGILKHVL